MKAGIETSQWCGEQGTLPTMVNKNEGEKLEKGFAEYQKGRGEQE